MVEQLLKNLEAQFGIVFKQITTPYHDMISTQQDIIKAVYANTSNNFMFYELTDETIEFVLRNNQVFVSTISDGISDRLATILRGFLINRQEPCPICLDEVDQLRANVRCTACSHIYHLKCCVNRINILDPKMHLCPHCSDETYGQTLFAKTFLLATDPLSPDAEDLFLIIMKKLDPSHKLILSVAYALHINGYQPKSERLQELLLMTAPAIDKAITKLGRPPSDP